MSQLNLIAFWLFIKENVTVFKDLITIATSTILAYIAFQGLKTWRRQLIGNTEYEHARKLLRTIYRVRDAVNIVRGPFISSLESGTAMKEVGIEVKEGDAFDKKLMEKSQEAVYQRRWKKMIEAMTEYEIEAFEAEALWGTAIFERLKPLKQCVNDLNWAVGVLLNPEKQKNNPKRREEVDSIVYSFDDLTNPETANPFSKKMVQTIGNLEEFLKPKLRL